jgi:hypothetical protein
MRIEQGVQPNHSEYMRLVATFADEKNARKVYEKFVQHLAHLFARANIFPCASFGRSFESRKEFLRWKRKEWDAIADERCRLQVEKRDGRIHVVGDYGLILDDWSREETAVAFDGSVIALRVYTAGYGLDYVEKWLGRRGASVQVLAEGEEYDYRSLEDAVAEVQAQARKKRPCGLRAEKRNHDSAGSKRDG